MFLSQILAFKLDTANYSTMTDSPRRSFLTRIAAGTSAFAAAFALPGDLNAQVQVQARESHELDRWLDELRGRHRQIFDILTKEHVSEMAYARNFLVANNTEYGYGDTELSVIVSLRHDATAYGYNDAIWAKYKLGEVLDVSIDGAPATRNPLLKNARGGDGMIAILASRGARFTACGLSTSRYSQEWSPRVGMTPAEVRAEIVANLVPNARIVPAGVVVLNRAQERGFSYIYVG